MQWSKREMVRSLTVDRELEMKSKTEIWERNLKPNLKNLLEMREKGKVTNLGRTGGRGGDVIP